MSNKLRVIALAACLAASGAQAQSYTKYSGTKVDFYFDTAVFSNSTVTINDDVLTLTDKSPYSLFEPQQFIVVPHGDFLLSNYVSGVLKAQYGYGAANWYTGMMEIDANASINVSSGTFKNGAFNIYQSNVASAGAEMVQWTSGGSFVDVPIDPCDFPDPYYGCSYTVFVPGSGTLPVAVSWDGRSGQNNTPGYFSNAIQVTSQAWVWGDGGGTMDSISFSFDGVAAPVPEPGTYALLLAGLGMIGYAARRKAGGKV